MSGVRGRGGPARMPTEVAVLRGVRSSRINREAPVPLGDPPTAPHGLSLGAQVEWNRILPSLLAMGTAKDIDAIALAGYCETVGVFHKLCTIVDIEGPILYGEDGIPRKNPAFGAMLAASHELRMWAREFGFTPSARAPLHVEHRHTVEPVTSPDRLLS